MIQQGQVFELKRASRERGPLWAYRYRVGGRDSRRVQRGGFASEQDAVAALVASADPWLRSCGAYAIGALGLHRLAGELDRLDTGGDPHLRETVRQARARLAGEEPVPIEPTETPIEAPHVHQAWASSADEMGLGRSRPDGRGMRASAAP